MLRWLTRLLIFGLVAAAIAFAISRMMGQDDEDFEDFDELDSNFEFQETPVEIDVRAEEGTGGASAASAGGGATGDIGDNEGVRARHRGLPDTGTLVEPASETSRADGGGSAGTTVLHEDQVSETDAPGTGERLTAINGIGSAYEARLQAVGVNSIGDLANADANALSEQIEVIGGATTIEDWISQARSYNSGEQNS
jgi:predicted flap endonuclease-1-like 5' DNA nuclease